jgi:hypothetical protein
VTWCSKISRPCKSRPMGLTLGRETNSRNIRVVSVIPVVLFLTFVVNRSLQWLDKKIAEFNPAIVALQTEVALFS